MSIYTPLIVRPDATIHLEIRCTDNIKGKWIIEVEGQEECNGTFAQEKKRYITAEMSQIETVSFDTGPDSTVDLEQIKKLADEQILLENLYKGCRSQNLIHTGFIKAEGVVYCLENEHYVDLRLGAEAFSSASRYMFHPTLIDGSGVSAGMLLSSFVKEMRLPEDQKLFLPLFYASFKASALIQESCVMRIKKRLFEEAMNYYTKLWNFLTSLAKK